MNHIWNLIKKELRELLTPATIIPMVFIIIIFAAMGPLMSGQIESATEKPTVGLVDASTGGIYTGIAIDEIDKNAIVVNIDASVYDDNDRLDASGTLTKAMQDAGVDILLVITPDYNVNISGINSGGTTQGEILTYWYQEDSGSMMDLSSAIVSTIIAAVSTATSEELMSQQGVTNPDYVMNPVAYAQDSNYLILSTGVFNGYTPDQISSSLMMQNMFVAIIMMLIIIMIGSILISSMGSEKENKTLETLLTLPISRTTVVTGKIIGSAIVGLLFGVVYMIGMYFGLGSTMSAGSVDLNELGLALGLTDWLVVGAFLFMAIVCALGLCMILGAFAKNYKAAQTLIMPIVILAIIPMFLTIFGSFGSYPAVIQAVMFAIPFSQPMMIMGNLMFGNTTLIIAGFVYLLAFALVTLYITVRLYKSDILLTGFIRKKESKWNLSLGKKKSDHN